MIRSLLSLAFVAGSASTASAQLSIADDGTDVGAYATNGAHTYTIKNTGPDNNIVAIAYNSAGDAVSWVNISKGGSKPVDVPAGGRVDITDQDCSGPQTAPALTNDANDHGATYTIT